MDGRLIKGSIMILLLMLVFVSAACVSAESNDTTVLTLSKSGITINYPSNWGYSDALSSYSIMAISKADSVDSFGVGQVDINIEKGGQAYVLLYSAPLDKFESNLYVFDYIVSDIRIT